MPEFKPSSTMTTCWAYKTHSVCVTECVTTPPGDFITWSDQSKAHKAAVKAAMDPSTGHPPSPDCEQPVPGVQGTTGKK